MRYIFLFLFPIVLNAQIVSVTGGSTTVKKNIVEQYASYNTLRADSNNLVIDNILWLKTNDYSSPYIVKTTVDGLVNDSVSCIKIANNKYGIIQIKDVLKPEYFGAKADFRRDSVTCVATSSTITCSTCSFTSADVGKVVAVKASRDYAAYRTASVTMNCKILTYLSSTQVVLDSVMDYSGKKEMLWGTNNFDPFQKMFNYGNLKNVRNVEIGKGTYYIVPAKGKSMKPRVTNYRGLVLYGGFKVRGAGKNNTTLKYGEEDIMRVVEAQVFDFVGLYLQGNGDFEISDLNVESADRFSTETAMNHVYAVNTEFTVDILQNVTLRDMSITSDWDQIFQTSKGGKWNSVKDSVEHWNTYTIERVYYETHCQGITVFSEGPCKKLNMIDVVCGKSGAIQEFNLLNAATIRLGSDTIRVVNNPNFSFYDFLSTYSDSNRKPRLRIGGTVGSFTADVVTILNPTTARLSATSPSNYTADSLFEYSYHGPSEFHATYIHPNVSNYWRNVRFYNCNGFGLHIFASGHQPGKIQGYEFDNVVQYTPDGSIASTSLLDNNIDLKPFDEGGYIIIRNFQEQPFYFGNSSKLKIYNSRVNLSAQDTTELYNCTGYLTMAGTTKTYKVFGGAYDALSYTGTNCKVFISGARSTFTQITNNCESVEGFVWNGGGLGHLRLSDFNTNGEITSSGVFRFDNLSYEKQQYAWFVDYPTLSSSDNVLLSSKVQFNNCNIEFNTFDTIGTIVRGFFPLPNNGYTTIINSTCNPTVAKPNEYESWTKVRVPVLYNRYKFNFGAATSIQTIFPAGANFLTSSPNYMSYYQNLIVLRGPLFVECMDTFKFTHGGLMRLQYSGPRTQNETVAFVVDYEHGVLIETSNNIHERIATPSWTGLNLERVYNSKSTGPLYWEYSLTTVDTVRTYAVSSSTAIEFDLNYTPYLGFREKRFIDPSTYITISVPLQAGGTETFTVTEYGALVGSAGSKGALRMTDGHVKLRMSALANGTITVNYKRISTSGWNALGTK